MSGVDKWLANPRHKTFNRDEFIAQTRNQLSQTEPNFLTSLYIEILADQFQGFVDELLHKNSNYLERLFTFRVLNLYTHLGIIPNGRPSPKWNDSFLQQWESEQQV